MAKTEDVDTSTNGMFRTVEYDSASSTNDIIKKAMAFGEPEGLAVCARRQTGGYGRRGNKWSSSPGGLYLSVLLRPSVDSAQLASLPLVAAIAVSRTIAAVVGSKPASDVKIKWPNDVVLAGSGWNPGKPFYKLCGISTEKKGDAVCLGIGVNVFRPKEDDFNSPTYEGDRNVPAYLEDLADEQQLMEGELSVEGVRDLLLRELELVYKAWSEGSFSIFQAEFDRISLLNGLGVVVDETGMGKPIAGNVCGVDEEGHLVVVSDEDGEAVHVATGTIRIYG